jgi:hypothetical protein
VTSFRVDFGGSHRKETRWTRYREVELYKRGLSPWEIMALKFNRFGNPRVRDFLKDIEDEIKRIQSDYGLPSFYDAVQFRRENWEQLVDEGEIEESDPYIRMNYFED